MGGGSVMKWLTLLMLLPLAGAAIISALPKSNEKAANHVYCAYPSSRVDKIEYSCDLSSSCLDGLPCLQSVQPNLNLPLKPCGAIPIKGKMSSLCRYTHDAMSWLSTSELELLMAVFL